MWGAANPITHTGGVSEDGAAEVEGLYTDHVPTVMAGTVIVAGVVLYLLKRWDFRFVVAGSVGGR